MIPSALRFRWHQSLRRRAISFFSPIFAITLTLGGNHTHYLKISIINFFLLYFSLELLWSDDFMCAYYFFLFPVLTSKLQHFFWVFIVHFQIESSYRTLWLNIFIPLIIEGSVTWKKKIIFSTFPTNWNTNQPTFRLLGH